MDDEEFDALTEMLASYRDHILSNPHTLLPRYFGVFEISALGAGTYCLTISPPTHSSPQRGCDMFHVCLFACLLAYLLAFSANAKSKASRDGTGPVRERLPVVLRSPTIPKKHVSVSVSVSACV